jgi:anti-anti-sigma factor
MYGLYGSGCAMPFIGDPRTGFTVTTPRAAGVSVVAVRGELTLATVGRLQPAFEAAVAAGRPVVIDLFEVSFMDSQGLFAMLVLRKRLAEQSCRLTVACDPDGTVDMVFRVSGTHDVFELFASRRAAAAAARRLGAPA